MRRRNVRCKNPERCEDLSERSQKKFWTSRWDVGTFVSLAAFSFSSALSSHLQAKHSHSQDWLGEESGRWHSWKRWHTRKNECVTLLNTESQMVTREGWHFAHRFSKPFPARRNFFFKKKFIHAYAYEKGFENDGRSVTRLPQRAIYQSL
jgi:hypothetical protein